MSLIALLIPGTGFAIGLLWLRTNPQFSWISVPGQWPWEIWGIGISGLLATAGGVADWAYHRLSGVIVGPREKKYELIALAFGGVPLFLLMCMASLSQHPFRYLLPVLVVLLFTVALICFDEFVFHTRRCKPIETLMHRFLVYGYGVAWLAWAHWCFVRRIPEWIRF